jgi:hypothetical protein
MQLLGYKTFVQLIIYIVEFNSNVISDSRFNPTKTNRNVLQFACRATCGINKLRRLF